MVVEFHLPLFRPDACRNSRADQLSPPLVDHKMEGRAAPVSRPYNDLEHAATARFRQHFNRATGSEGALLLPDQDLEIRSTAHVQSASYRPLFEPLTGFRSNHHGLPS